MRELYEGDPPNPIARSAQRTPRQRVKIVLDSESDLTILIIKRLKKAMQTEIGAEIASLDKLS